MRTASFTTHQLAERPDDLAPDGSEIRFVGSLAGGSVAHGALAPGGVSVAVCHRTVEEIWFVLGGRAEVWCNQDGREEFIEAVAGTGLTIPLGTHFQFRATGDLPFTFIMCTMPPWPGPDEAFVVDGPWTPTVG